jgi:hypothetical protein
MYAPLWKAKIWKIAANFAKSRGVPLRLQGYYLHKTEKNRDMRQAFALFPVKNLWKMFSS